MRTVQVQSRIDEANGVVVLVLADAGGAELPTWTPGAHIDVHVERPGEPPTVRQYSLCGDPADRRTYRVAVLREEGGSGVSRHLHDAVRRGQLLRISDPRDLFGFTPAERIVFIVGGIGITPILPMVAAAAASGADWMLHDAVRGDALFAEELAAYGDRVRMYRGDRGERLAVADVVRSAGSAPIYACGPDRLLREIESEALGCGATVHLERFVNDNIVSSETDHPFEVELSITGKTITVLPGESILDRVAAAGVPAPSSCRGGTCGTCETFVVSGEPDHRDAVLNAREREESEVMMICVSRCKGDRLVLEL